MISITDSLRDQIRELEAENAKLVELLKDCVEEMRPHYDSTQEREHISRLRTRVRDLLKDRK